MRHFLANAVLALTALCLTRPLPAQFPSLSDQGGMRSWLGVGLRDVEMERAKVIKLGDPRGVEVVTVYENSPAEQAGIHAGDILLSFNSEPIVGAQQLGRLVSETPPGRKIKIQLWREGKVSTIVATTGASPNGGMPVNLPSTSFEHFTELLQPGSFPSPLFSWTNPQLGIECEALSAHDSHNSQLAEFFGVSHGVLVRAVAKDSPAAKAGLRAGDVLTQIGEHAVADPQELSSFLRQEHHTTKPLSVELMRDHKSLNVKINLLQEPQ